MLLIMLLSVSILNAMENTSVLLGKDFVSSSSGINANNTFSDDGAKLVGLIRAGFAIYEIDLPDYASSFSLKIDFINPKHQNMEICIWNYGTEIEDESIRLPKDKPESPETLNPHWIRWESTGTEDNYTTQSPEFLPVYTPDLSYDFIGKDNTVRLMLYAEGGIPPNEDGLFYINALHLHYITNDDLETRLMHSSKVKLENEYLITTGIGKIPNNVPEARKRPMALRIAKLDAYRNLSEVVGVKSIDRENTSTTSEVETTLTDAEIIDTQYNEDGTVEVTLRMPLKAALNK